MKQETKNNIIIWTDRILTRTVYLVYPVLLIMLLIRNDSDLLRAVLVPGISFVLLSLFRALINAPRPYEIKGIEPVIKRKGSGKSFPSRHAFSVFLIATSLFYFYPAAGIAVGIAGVLLVSARVLGGVHFVKDVVAGALIGIACGLTGFYLNL